MQRRMFVGASAALLTSLGFTRSAEATLVRGLSLEELVAQSSRILVGRALDATSQWVTLGGRKRIVTDVRVRVEDVLAKAPPEASEIMVRTLGGTVGNVGALVHGEAELMFDEECVVFLRVASEGIHRIIGMAQGHYPLRPDEKRVQRLHASPRSAEILANDRSALRRLVGRDLSEAHSMIRGVLKP